MQNLLILPEIQSGLIPFFIALMMGVVLKSNKFVLAGAGVIAGFIATALLLNGLDFSPLNGTRKIILAGVAAAIVAVFFQIYLTSWRYRLAILGVIGILAFLWVAWPVLMRTDGISKWVLAVGCSAYVLWHIVMLDNLKEKPLQAASCVLALGVGTAFSAILGASALYGQLSMSMAAAAGALLCLLLFSELKSGLLLTYPAGLLLGLFGTATLLFADLNWIALVFLALIPLVARVPLPERYSRWQTMLILNMAVMLPAAMAIFSVWYITEDSLY